MFIELCTQVRENYGTPAVPYWKNKFGSAYLLPVDKSALLAADNRQAFLQELATRAIRQINCDNAMLQQHVIDWELVPEDHYTDSELNQLQFEGEIRYWSPIVELAEESAPSNPHGGQNA